METLEIVKEIGRKHVEIVKDKKQKAGKNDAG